MGLCAFVGDEVTAAGFRLAGVEVHAPEPARAPALFRRLLGEAELIVLTAEAARWLPDGDLRDVLARDRPLILVIPDIRGRSQPSDASATLKRQLGMVE